MTELLLTEEIGTSFVDVALPLPVHDTFTYRIPPDLNGKIRPGARVRVPFRNRTIVGFAVAMPENRQVDRAKDILELIDTEPVVSDHLLRLAKWISEYYFSSWGEAIANLIPKPVRRGTSKHPPTGRLKEAPQFAQKSDHQLTPEQAAAHTQIKEAIAARSFKEFFLFGVTGGGKSELYIRAIQEVLAQGRSAICLVPEIALTEQLKLFFLGHFRDELEILHSGMSDWERFRSWSRIKNNEKSVILGARSAVFAPAAQLGIIILDEEQEAGYKQDQVPRYHAREAARWRAQDAGCVFLSGTATPTLETMSRTASGDVQILRLTKRVDARPMPEVRVVDISQGAGQKMSGGIISYKLKIAIERALTKENGILLMLNRRGHSTQIRCNGCSHVLFCPHCNVALTFHQNHQEVLCHYCNYRTRVPQLCGQCGSVLLKFAGVGTEKVESEVARLFPHAVVARLDRDASKRRGAQEDILGRFRNRQIDILVGTQMIAKGFDFGHVTVVGIINADTGLLLPDFRSAERTFQLLTQMAGRAGRGKAAGEVLIQTYSPRHYSVQFAARHDYERFFEEEMARRRALRYPPFSQLINIAFRSKREQNVYLHANELRKLLDKENADAKFEILGPAPLPFYRLRGHYRWHVMLKSTDEAAMHRALRSALAKLRRKAGTHVSVDVDPVSIL